jgi:hypothetical protein
MSGKPGGYVGQDFCELSRVAVLERAAGNEATSICMIDEIGGSIRLR